MRHCAGGHKENELRFNGKKVFDIYSEAGDWVDTVTDGVFLSKGENTITLGFTAECPKRFQTNTPT